MAFEPRQWPPQPCQAIVSVAVKEKVEGEEHTFLMAISIDVITSKENSLMVSIDEFLIPSNHFGSRSLAEVLAVDFRLIAVGVDVLGSLLRNFDGVDESLFELNSLGVVAGWMDRETLDLNGRLGVGGCSGAGDGDGGDFSVLDDWRSSSDGSKDCIEKELSAHLEGKE